MRSSRMHLGRHRPLPMWIMAILGIAAILVMFEGYRLVMPFVSKNPLYHEVNFGQTIFGNWEYEGEDPEGYLEFYNPKTGARPILPPHAKLFGADGRWVVIKHADAASLTYATPLASAPPYWYLVMVMFVGGGFWFMMAGRKRIRKGRMNMQSRNGLRVPSLSSPKASRFRPSKSRKPRIFR